MGALGNIISGLFGGGAKQPAPAIEQDKPEAQARDNEHSKAATALAKPEVKTDSSRDPSAFIKNASPNTEDKFSTFDVKKFFEKLQSLNIGTDAAEYLEYGVDLNTVSTFELFQSTMREVQAKLPKAEAKTETPESQAKELQNLEKELAGLAELFGGMEAAQAEAKPKEANPESPKAKTEDKPTLAKSETKKNETSELDALLKQLAA